jgi:hypothetical protein
MTHAVHPPTSRRRALWTRISAIPLAGAALGVAACGVTTPTTPATASNAPVAPVIVTQPAPQTTAPQTSMRMPMTLPTDLVGENGQVAYQELKAAGFTDPVFHSDNGKAVLLYSDWTVVSARLEHGSAVVEVKK